MITSEHSFQRCPYSSAYHHLTGEISPAVDIDSLQIMNTHIENTFLEYDNNEQKRRTRVAIIDFKRQNDINGKRQSVSMSYETMLIQQELANDLNLPFFIILTYLSEEFPVKMYHVLPANQLAEDFFLDHNYFLNGQWMTLKAYALFHHQLRGKTFNPFTIIRKQFRVNELINMPDCLTLGDLPDYKVKYTLPKINLNTRK